MSKKVGRFGDFGGQYVPETVMNAVHELEQAYDFYKNDPQFQKELTDLYHNYAGRPSMLYYAEKMTKDLGGAKIYIKREDLNHTGSHKINNVLGQALLAKKMGKKRLIAETGAGQHGVATATVAALFGMECEVYMGEEDMERQALNVYRMNLLGAKVTGVKSGTRTLKDAVNEAMRDWTANVENTYYLIGSAMGPHPYPTMVRDFQKIIGEETKRQLEAMEHTLPDCVVACVGGATSSGMSLRSTRVRKKSYSIWDAAGKPTSISLKPSFTRRLNISTFSSTTIGSTRAWLPSLRSTLHHIGAFIISLFGHVRSGKSTTGTLLYL